MGLIIPGRVNGGGGGGAGGAGQSQIEWVTVTGAHVDTTGAPEIDADLLEAAMTYDDETGLWSAAATFKVAAGGYRGRDWTAWRGVTLNDLFPDWDGDGRHTEFHYELDASESVGEAGIAHYMQLNISPEGSTITRGVGCAVDQDGNAALSYFSDGATFDCTATKIVTGRIHLPGSQSDGMGLGETRFTGIPTDGSSAMAEQATVGSYRHSGSQKPSVVLGTYFQGTPDAAPHTFAGVRVRIGKVTWAAPEA